MTRTAKRPATNAAAVTATVSPQEQLAAVQEAARAQMAEVQRAIVERVKAWIGQHYLKNPTLAEIADEAGYSPFHFHRVFTKYAGCNPKDYVDQLRIARAKELLHAGALSIEEVATHLKFAHQSHFTSRFALLVGLPPAKWLKRERAIAATTTAAGAA